MIETVLVPFHNLGELNRSSQKSVDNTQATAIPKGQVYGHLLRVLLLLGVFLLYWAIEHISGSSVCLLLLYFHIGFEIR